MEAYSGILSFIANVDKYISVFCGTLTTTIVAGFELLDG